MNKTKDHKWGDNVIIYEGSQIDESVEIGPFSIIYPDVVIEAGVRIMTSTIIGKPPTTGRNQVELTEIGKTTIIKENTFVGDHVIIYKGVNIGKNVYLADKCLIRENVRLYENVVIGTSVIVSFNAQVGPLTKIMSGSNIGGNMIIGKNCFIGVHVCSFNDKNPDVLKPRDKQISAEIGDNVVVGSNSTIMPNITIADNIKIGANSLVLKSLQVSGGLYFGNPIKLKN